MGDEAGLQRQAVLAVLTGGAGIMLRAGLGTALSGTLARGRKKNFLLFCAANVVAACKNRARQIPPSEKLSFQLPKSTNLRETLGGERAGGQAGGWLDRGWWYRQTRRQTRNLPLQVTPSPPAFTRTLKEIPEAKQQGSFSPCFSQSQDAF